MTDVFSAEPIVHVSGAGPALVLLHCLGVDHHVWDCLRPLESDFTLVRYDLPGHGETPVPKAGYGIADLSRQLAGLLRGRGFARAHVAGISLGGLIAQHFAARQSDMVDRLMLFDTTPRYVDEMRAMWAVRAETARQEGVAALVPGLLPIWFSDAAIREGGAGVRYVRDTLARCGDEGYALACEALAVADLRADAARIRAPTLVVCGDDDIPSFLHAARWLAQTIAGAKLAWIRGARHASILEKPDHALDLVRGFLA